jgi:hypothetical protein
LGRKRRRALKAGAVSPRAKYRRRSYGGRAWKALRYQQLRDHPRCERCQAPAVHHRTPITVTAHCSSIERTSVHCARNVTTCLSSRKNFEVSRRDRRRRVRRSIAIIRLWGEVGKFPGTPDHRHRRLLRACCEWPGYRRAPEQRDELSPSHTEHRDFLPSRCGRVSVDAADDKSLRAVFSTLSLTQGGGQVLGPNLLANAVS